MTPCAFGRGDGLRLQRLEGDPEAGRLLVLDPFARDLLAYVASDRERVRAQGRARATPA